MRPNVVGRTAHRYEPRRASRGEAIDPATGEGWAVLATYPQWVSRLMNGRHVTWAQMTYFPAPLTITLDVAAVAGVATLTARLRWIGSRDAGGRAAATHR